MTVNLSVFKFLPVFYNAVAFCSGIVREKMRFPPIFFVLLPGSSKHICVPDVLQETMSPKFKKTRQRLKVLRICFVSLQLNCDSSRDLQ